MNTSLRDQLITAGYEDNAVKIAMNNSFTGKASPTMNACYQTELYQNRATIWSLKKRTIKARDYSYGFVRISKARIVRAMDFEASYQATKKADREMKALPSVKVHSRTQSIRKGDWNERL